LNLKASDYTLYLIAALHWPDYTPIWTMMLKNKEKMNKVQIGQMQRQL